MGSERDIAIIGIGIHPFGRTEGASGIDQGVYAARQALGDAGLGWDDIQFAYGGSRDGGEADTMVRYLGLTGIQFLNVRNACATGGSALFGAYTTILSGERDIGMAIGFDKHPRGAFSVDITKQGIGSWYGEVGLAVNPQFFGMKMQRYMHDHGITSDTLIRVAEKAFRNGSLNPNAWRTRALSYEEVANSNMLCHPLRHYMFCSPGEGAVALVLCSSKVAHKYTSKPVYLRAASIRTRLYGSFEVTSPSQPAKLSDSPTVQASRAAYEMAGVGPEDIDIAQVQDTEAGAEIMHMAENGLCKHGDQEALIHEGATEITGRLPINTDGGCMANGEPVGASGLRQVYEICLQLRGDAGSRQVPKELKTGYTHVYGAPGVSAVTILTK
jgi:acetyl-CoA acetyltransferase